MYCKGINFIIFILIIATSETKDCGPKFKGKCSCGNKEYDGIPQYVVNCTNEGYTTTDILKNLPAETQVLIFVGNNIPEVPWNIFGTLNTLENLRVVDMSNNHIKDIKGKTYHHVPNVERLILNHNEIVISMNDDADVNYHHPRVFSNFINLHELHLTNAFADNTDATLANDLHDIFVNSNLTKLYKLHLEQNEIVTFRDHKVFCDLPQLHDLHLGDNQLSYLSFNVSCLKHLRFLDLQKNLFSTLTKHEVEAMDKLYSKVKNEQQLAVDLRRNPFTCDCGILDFVSWLKSTNITVRNVDELRCVNPNRKEPGTQLLKLKLNICKPTVKTAGYSRRQRVTIGILVFVAIMVLGLIVFIVHVNRQRFRTRLTPLIEAISKKVQYTTIKNRDNIEDI